MFIIFFNDTATTEIYTLSLHDALPIYGLLDMEAFARMLSPKTKLVSVSHVSNVLGDRKSTRLNSSHANISYAVFCLKKKNKKSTPRPIDRRNFIYLTTFYTLLPQVAEQ